MSDERSAPDLRGLEDRYEIRGELRGSGTARHYIGRTRDERPVEVAIVVATRAEGGQTSDLAHFAADSRILASGGHRAIPRAIESRWVGSDSVAVVSERVVGETLAERLERGDRFPHPQIARILGDVNAALDWARESGVVHRGVTPDSLVFERDTDHVRVSFVPTRIPMTGVPDAATDARTIGTLAWAFLTGEPYVPGENRSLAELCPNLALRVVEATERIIRSKDHAAPPDVDEFLSTIAAADVLKQAEVELLAQKEEYEEAHRRELEKCEVQRQEVAQHAAEQAALLAGEREEFRRQIAEERAAIEAERVQFEALMHERKERFAGVRAELDQQRAEMERRVAELERYRAEVAKVRDEALKAREEATHAREDARLAARRAAEAAAAHAAAVRAANEAIARAKTEASANPLAGSTIPTAEEIEQLVDAPDIPAVEPFVAPKLAKPPKPPKWDKLEPVDLEHTDEAAVVAEYGGRPRWMIPSAVATLVLILVAAGYGMTHRSTPSAATTVRIGTTTVVPTAPAAQAGRIPRGGFLTQSAQSAGGAVTPSFAPGALVSTAPGAAPASDSTGVEQPPLTQEQLDSIAEARAARARRAAAREAERQEAARAEQARRALQAATDSFNASRGWNDRRDANRRSDAYVGRDTILRRDTIFRQFLEKFVRPDTNRPRIDTLVRPRPDTIRSPPR
jgi:hypothetical protein